jgi:hypothetical protein
VVAAPHEGLAQSAPLVHTRQLTAALLLARHCYDAIPDAIILSEHHDPDLVEMSKEFLGSLKSRLPHSNSGADALQLREIESALERVEKLDPRL